MHSEALDSQITLGKRRPFMRNSMKPESKTSLSKNSECILQTFPIHHYNVAYSFISIIPHVSNFSEVLN